MSCIVGPLSEMRIFEMPCRENTDFSPWMALSDCCLKLDGVRESRVVIDHLEVCFPFEYEQIYITGS